MRSKYSNLFFIIFWSVIVPIATHELLILSDKHIALLKESQKYAGEKIQRFYSRAPIICSFSALGWVRLEHFIEIKKLLSIRDILSLEDNEPIKIAPRERAAVFF